MTDPDAAFPLHSAPSGCSWPGCLPEDEADVLAADVLAALRAELGAAPGYLQDASRRHDDDERDDDGTEDGRPDRMRAWVVASGALVLMFALGALAGAVAVCSAAVDMARRLEWESESEAR